MAGLIDHEDYEEKVISICPNDTVGEIVVVGALPIALPEKPKHKDIAGHNLRKEDQRWERVALPKDLSVIRSMDEWSDEPVTFRKRHMPYIDEEFRRRSEGFWFYNLGEATYITGNHYMLLQWSKIDVGYPFYFEFQRDLYYHKQACYDDPRSFGQVFTKCRRSGYTVTESSDIVAEATIVKDKLLGIQSKTGGDAQENVFMKKLVPIFKSYPFFFKPIQDGSTNPRMELAFREPSKRITKNNKTSSKGEALNTVINWKNTTNNAYDGEKLKRLFLDEAGKWGKPSDINEAWRVQKTCLMVGRKIVGKAYVGSTVNPMDQGGKEYKKLWADSDPTVRDANGRTKSGLYRLFIPAYVAMEGFFDVYGRAVIDDPDKPVMGIDGEEINLGSKTYLQNERDSLRDDPPEYNERVRQFPWNEDEAFRDSITGSAFDVGRIYQQLDHNNNLYPRPNVTGNFRWKVKDKEVVFEPRSDGKFVVSWLPPKELQNKCLNGRNGLEPGNPHIGVGGVDSYDIDQVVDGRGSNGALHLYNKFNMVGPTYMFVLEYATRPPLADIFYEDVLMASFFYGYPILIENNKYGIARYFERRGYLNYLLDRPKHLQSTNQRVKVKTKGIPSNSSDVIQAHAQAIEKYIYEHVGENSETGEMGAMYLDKTLEEWISYDINNRTKYDRTISSGLALLAAQNQVKEKKDSGLDNRQWFRRHKPRSFHE